METNCSLFGILPSDNMYKVVAVGQRKAEYISRVLYILLFHLIPYHSMQADSDEQCHISSYKEFNRSMGLVPTRR